MSYIILDIGKTQSIDIIHHNIIIQPTCSQKTTFSILYLNLVSLYFFFFLLIKKLIRAS